jgi:glycosyltransferase involved in cell wall biosynthesis
MSNFIKYSILIPTYNKIEYVKYSIESVLSINYENFELVVSDDFSDDGTWEYLQSINDKRLKVIRPPHRLGVTLHYEYLLNIYKGEWVVILGDDDGLLPYFFQVLDILFENKSFKNIEAISTKPAFYYYDNVEELYGERVVYYDNYFKRNQIINSKLSILFCILGIKTRVDLPSLYTGGLFKRSLIERIKKKSKNVFFHSMVPDYYSMIAGLYETEKFLRVNIPIFWIGTTSKSGGRGLKVYDQEIINFNNNNGLKINLSEEVSASIHATGIAPIYFLECILKHPYLVSFLKKEYIKFLGYIASLVYFEKYLIAQPWRIKNEISFKDYKYKVTEELYKLNFKKLTIIIFYYLIKFFYFLDTIYIKLTIVKNFFYRNLSNKCIFLISSDRKLYNNIIDCNKFLDNIFKKINLDSIKNK